MNVLIVALDFKPMTGGVAEYTHQIALHLQLSGDNVVVLSKNTDGDKEFDSTCPYTVIRYDYDRHLKSGVVPLCRASYKAIKGVIRERQIDAVISNNLQIAHIFWLASKLRSIPFCIFTHGTEVNRRVALGKDFRQVIEFFNEGIKRLFVLKRADKVFCNSSFTRRVVENLGVSYNKTAILHPGIPSACLNSNSSVVKSDLDTATRKLQFDNKKVILTLGRVIERKGIDLVIRAMQIVREKVPNAVYVIAGDGPYRTALEKLAKKLYLHDSVIFTGYIGDEEKDLYYSIADVMVMPSRELDNGDVEGFGIVFLEANAYGKPVIGGRSGGVVDAVVDGETGLLVDPQNTQEIASKIIYLLENEDYAKKLGIRGKERVESEFNWLKIVAGMREELAKLNYQGK